MYKPEDNFKGAIGGRWKPGQSGNPTGGRPDDKHSITWWYKKLLAQGEGLSAKQIATEAIGRAKQGSLPHTIEITDRTDGKIPSEVTLKGLIVHVGNEYAQLGLEMNKKDLKDRKLLNNGT